MKKIAYIVVICFSTTICAMDQSVVKSSEKEKYPLDLYKKTKSEIAALVASASKKDRIEHRFNLLQYRGELIACLKLGVVTKVDRKKIEKVMATLENNCEEITIVEKNLPFEGDTSDFRKLVAEFSDAN